MGLGKKEGKNLFLALLLLFFILVLAFVIFNLNYNQKESYNKETRTEGDNAPFSDFLFGKDKEKGIKEDQEKEDEERREDERKKEEKESKDIDKEIEDVYFSETLPLKKLRNTYVHDYVQGMYKDLHYSFSAFKGTVSLPYTMTFTNIATNEKITKTDSIYDDGQHDDEAAGDGNFGNHVLIDLPVGEYKWTIWITTPTTTFVYGSIVNIKVFAPISGECKEFVSGTNDPNDPARINIVALGINLGTKTAPDWNTFFNQLNFGLYFDTGARPPYYTAGKYNWNNYAFFKLEPLKSYKDKFNVWYIDPMYFGSNDAINYKEYLISRCPFYNSKPVVFDPTVQRASGGLPVLMNPFEWRSGTLAHEYGHSLARVTDEYPGKCSIKRKQPSTEPFGTVFGHNLYHASSTTNTQVGCEKYSGWNYLVNTCFASQALGYADKLYFSSCPSTYEEVSCYNGAGGCSEWDNSYMWRPAYRTLMYALGAGAFSVVDIREFCEKLVSATGEKKGICSQICLEGCPQGHLCRDPNNDGIGECIQSDAGCADADSDTICDTLDNCVSKANVNQEDYDQDKIGDVCDNDADGDGFNSIASGGTDCKDLDPKIKPGATEICGNNIDEDCSGADLVCPPLCVDNDGDGYGLNCPLGNENCDTNSLANPGLTEICDNVDNDCDGSIDDGITRTCGISTGECSEGVESCVDGEWTGVCAGAVNPIDPICSETKDNNCDIVVDTENCPCIISNARWSPNIINDGDSSELDYDVSWSECSPIQRYELNILTTSGVSFEGDKFTNMPQYEGFLSFTPGPILDCNDATKICKAAQFYFTVSKIHDSNKITSNMLTIKSRLDSDGDLYLKQDVIPSNYNTDIFDCNDDDPNIYPGQGCEVCTPQQEICNGIDDDCDTVIDNGGNLDCSGGTPYCSAGKCVQCTSSIQCNDGNLCTDDLCNAGTCSNINDNTNSCDDTLFCNGAESCSAGSCINTPRVIEDGIACTIGSCDETNDIIVQTPDNTQCYDGLWCNGFEVCDVNIGCNAGTPVVCDDGIACTTNLCIEEINMKDNIGQCAYPTTNCQCSTNAQCDDSNACTDDLCNPDKTCSNINNDANTCNDLFYCTINDRCSAGNCIGDSRSTDDGISCTDDKCDDATSTIIHTPINSICDNGLYCDGTETCNVAQGCVAGTPITCSDPLSCTIDSCNENTDTCSFTGIDNDGDSYSICAGANYDCDDSKINVHPNAQELCNGIDENCDGIKDEGCSCADFGGDVCLNEELCPGTEIKGDGTLQRCCSVQCTLPLWNSCSECGIGLFNVCDRTECYSIKEGCSFEPELFGIGTCNSCSNINSCEDYLDEQSCNDNKCSIAPCTFINGQCKNACIDIDGDSYGTGDTSLCLGVGIDCDESIVKGKDIYPNAPELCDGIDNQCLGDNGYGIIDEGCQVCGNRIKEGNEICDTDSVECSYKGYKGLQTCNGQCDGYGICVATESCGDGTIQIAAEEQCDDGNIADGDGCSALCTNENPALPPTLNVIAPEAKEYRNVPIPLEFIASNANSCHYILDGDITTRKDVNCNTNDILNIKPIILNAPESHKIEIFAVNANGQTLKTIDFSVIYTRLIGARYDEFKGIGETTNLDTLTDLELETIDLTLDDGIDGKIKFNEKLNLALEADLTTNIIDLDSNINIEDKKIEINSDILKGLNKKATLTFRNINFNDPKTQKNGVDCSTVDCVEISYTNGIYIVDVSGFSVYTVVEGQQQQPPPPADGGSPGNNGGGGDDGSGFITPPKKNETKDNRVVDIIVINGTGEELERVEITQEDTQNINIEEETRVVFEVEGSDTPHIIDFSIQENKIIMKIISNNKEYEILGDEVIQLLLGDKEVYFGVSEITEGRAIVTLGFERGSVEQKIGIIKPNLISYTLIGIAVMLILIIGLLIWKYNKQ